MSQAVLRKFRKNFPGCHFRGNRHPAKQELGKIVKTQCASDAEAYALLVSACEAYDVETRPSSSTGFNNFKKGLGDDEHFWAVFCKLSQEEPDLPGLAEVARLLLIQRQAEEMNAAAGNSSSERSSPLRIFQEPSKSADIYSHAYAGKDRIPLLGRKTEQRALEHFLKGDPDRHFQWMQIAGVAGQGKTRLAAELIQKARDQYNWQAGFWHVPLAGGQRGGENAFQQFWLNWKPDAPYLLVLDYVVSTGHVLGPVLNSLMERASTFDHPVRLLVLERQRWDRGGLVEAPHATSHIRFLHSRGRAAWFESLNDALPTSDLSDPDVLFEGHGVVELKRLSSSDLVRIVQDVFSAKAGTRQLRYGTSELAAILKRIDEAGRPLYAFFLGLVLPEGNYRGSWTREDLLKGVLENERLKRWQAAFAGAPPSLSGDILPLRLALLASMTEGCSRQQLLDVPDIPDFDDQQLAQALTLVCGPSEIGLAGPAGILPPLLPDLLGEWFVLSALKQRSSDACRILLQNAWRLSAAGMSRFLVRCLEDFPHLVARLPLCETPPDTPEAYEIFASVSSHIASLLIDAGLDVPNPVVDGLRLASGKSDAKAMNMLGLILAQGRDGPPDEKTAIKLFERSAEEGFLPGMFNHAVSMHCGLGCHENKVEAVAWFKKTADRNFAPGLHALGTCYETGEGIEPNPQKAAELYSSAVVLGHTPSLVSLGTCFMNEVGVDKDPEKAVSLFQTAADAGDASAMYALGLCYANGDGAIRNPLKSVAMYLKAAMAGDPDAIDLLQTFGSTGEPQNPGTALSNLNASSQLRPLLSAVLPASSVLAKGDRNLSVPSVTLGAEWACPPPINGDWRELEPGEVQDIAQKLGRAVAAINRPDLFTTLRITAARQSVLPCYPDLLLLDVQMTSPTGRRTCVSALATQHGAFLLDGQAATIGTINPHFLSLETDEERRAYIRFFFQFSRGGAEPIHVIESLKDIPWQSGNSIHEAVPILPLEAGAVTGQNIASRVSGTVLFEKALYPLAVTLHRDGDIDALDDQEPIAKDLPIIGWMYEGLFRTMAKPEK